METKSKKEKGRAFVRKIVAILRQEVDASTYEVVGSGAGKDKGDIRVPRLDLVIEAKNHEKATVALWTLQADREGLGYSKTALFWRHPKSPSSNPDIRVDITLDYFLELVLRSAEPIIKKEDRQFAYKIKQLRESARAVLKEIDG